MHPLIGKTFLRFVLLHIYGLTVAWIFTLVEKRDKPAQVRMDRILGELRNEINLKYNMTDDDFGNFVKITAEAVTAGNELDWTFVNSWEFVSVAFTTIGYGNLTPRTKLGQGITMIACIIGIPTAVLAFKAAGELLTTCIRFLVIKTETAVLKRAEPKYVKKKTFAIACFIMFAVHMLMSTSAYYIENWTFMESVYAWFVTFSTIGFGDYVPLESQRRKMDLGEFTTSRIVIYYSLFYFPCYIGLCLMSCILNCIVDSLDQIRDFRDRKFMECCPSLLSFKRRVLCCKKEENQVDCARQETEST